jgi:hypothetical protein
VAVKIRQEAIDKKIRDKNEGIDEDTNLPLEILYKQKMAEGLRK